MAEQKLDITGKEAGRSGLAAVDAGPARADEWLILDPHSPPAPAGGEGRGGGFVPTIGCQLLRELIDRVPDQIYAKDSGGRFVVANAALRRFLGPATDGEVIGKTDADFFSPLAASSFAWEEHEILRTGQPLLNREAKVQRGDGPELWILSSKLPLVIDRATGAQGIVGINRDITQHKLDEEALTKSNQALAERERQLLATVGELQRSQKEMRAIQLQLVEADKMEVVGRLAAGVAHEVKNPLAIIGMAIDFLALCATPERREEFPVVLERIRQAVQRADGVIRALLDFSVPRKLDLVPTDINAVIELSQTLVKHELVRNHIHWRTELSPLLPLVQVDVVRIEQVLVNLFLNAIQAMPAMGTLTVRSRVVAGDAGAAGGKGSGAGMVMVEVLDTGSGISQDVLARIFEPFFTTKPTGQGTGLGLSVARAIIEQHGGTISIRNRPEGGACAAFTVKAQGEKS